MRREFSIDVEKNKRRSWKQFQQQQHNKIKIKTE